MGENLSTYKIVLKTLSDPGDHVGGRAGPRPCQLCCMRQFLSADSHGIGPLRLRVLISTQRSRLRTSLQAMVLPNTGGRVGERER